LLSKICVSEKFAGLNVLARLWPRFAATGEIYDKSFIRAMRAAAGGASSRANGGSDEKLPHRRPSRKQVHMLRLPDSIGNKPGACLVETPSDRPLRRNRNDKL
jgi:hypothetical protein